MDLRTARLLKKLTQEELGKKIEVTGSLVSQWERNKTTIPHKRQKQIENIIMWPIQFNQ